MTDSNIPMLGFVKLCVRNLDLAVEFYGQAFGLLPVDQFDTASIREIVLRGGSDSALILFEYKDRRALRRGNMSGPIGFHSADVDRCYDHAIACGAKSSAAPVNYGALRAAFLIDPDGHEIEIVGPT